MRTLVREELSCDEDDVIRLFYFSQGASLRQSIESLWIRTPEPDFMLSAQERGLPCIRGHNFELIPFQLASDFL